MIYTSESTFGRNYYHMIFHDATLENMQNISDKKTPPKNPLLCFDRFHDKQQMEKGAKVSYCTLDFKMQHHHILR